MNEMGAHIELASESTGADACCYLTYWPLWSNLGCALAASGGTHDASPDR